MITSTAGLAAAITLAAGGNGAVLLAASDAGPGLAPWLQGGGSAAAVGGLVYVARMIVKGDLVPRAVADRENETAAALRTTAERETKYRDLLTESQAREREWAKVATETVQHIADVTSELRWWRDQRERGRTTSLPARRSSTVREEDTH